jgi:hypothetical protein
MNRVEALRQIFCGHPDALFVLSNGLTSREAVHHLHQPQNFYLLHGMGEALSVGIGFALAAPEQEVVVIDGDGNALMGMASWSLMPQANVIYYVLDNGCYQTTGEQPLPTAVEWPSWCRRLQINRQTGRTPNPPSPEWIWLQTHQWLDGPVSSADKTAGEDTK